MPDHQVGRGHLQGAWSPQAAHPSLQLRPPRGPSLWVLGFPVLGASLHLSRGGSPGGPEASWKGASGVQVSSDPGGCTLGRPGLGFPHPRVTQARLLWPAWPPSGSSHATSCYSIRPGPGASLGPPSRELASKVGSLTIGHLLTQLAPPAQGCSGTGGQEVGAALSSGKSAKS